MSMMRILLGSLIAVGLACGNGTSSTAMDGSGERADAPLADVPGVADAPGVDGPGSDAPLACGTQTCGASQICVNPCCGGTAPQCTAIPDGGVCPSGSSQVAYCGQLGGPGCQQNPCTPAPPYCADLPASCAGTPAPSCLASLCMGPLNGRQLQCMCA